MTENSHRWFGPILSEFPEAVAREIATAARIKNQDPYTLRFPWVTIFPSDAIDDVCSRLLTVLQTPDYETPAYDPTIKDAVDSINDPRLAISGIVYHDLSRQWPQYTHVWTENLSHQFGGQEYGLTVAKN